MTDIDVQERLGKALAGAVERAPEPHATAVDAGAAWDAGRSRRRRRRAGVALTAAAAVAVVAVGSVAVVQHDPPRGVAPADGARSDGVASYPERVDGPRWWTRDVTGAGEPLAGVLRDDSYDSFGVTASGRLWRIPHVTESFGSDVVPVLSDDGTRLAWLREASTYQVLDLVTGEVVVYDGIGESRTDTTEPYVVNGQTPGFFSPDGSQLVVSGWPGEGIPDAPTSSSLLLDDEGQYHSLPLPTVPTRAVGAGETEVYAPIGWADDGHLYWRAVSTSERGRTTFTLVSATLDGQVTRVVPVPNVHARTTDQWMASVAPDGLSVYVRRSGDDLVVDATTGRVTERLRVDTADGCSPSWRGDQVLEPSRDGDGGALEALREFGDGPTATETVAVAERGSCLTLAPQALAGAPSTTAESWLLGTSTTWLAWHLDELVAGVAGVGALLLVLGWRRRRSARRA